MHIAYVDTVLSASYLTELNVHLMRVRVCRVCVCVCEGVGTVALVIAVTSLQEVPGFNLLWLSVWTVHVSPDLLLY